MKRIPAILTICALIGTATGCNLQQTSGNIPNRLNSGFTSDITMTTADSETKGILTRYGTDAWTVEFTEPPALSGVQLNFTDNEVEASYKGLAFSVPQSAQAVKTMLAEWMEIVDELSQQTELMGTVKENAVIYEGEIDEGEYTMQYTADGAPMAFSLPSYGLTITFENFTASGMPAESMTEGTSETTAIPTETTAAETT